MSANLARHTLNATWDLLFHARSRGLVAEEKSDLARLGREMEEGIPCRPIYNRAVREFCTLLRSSEVMGSARGADIECLLKEVDSLRVLVR